MVRDGSEDPRGGPGRVGGTSVGLGRVWGPTERFGTGRGTHKEVRDGSGQPRGGLVWVGGPTRRSGKGLETLGRSGTGLGTLN